MPVIPPTTAPTNKPVLPRAWPPNEPTTVNRPLAPHVRRKSQIRFQTIRLLNPYSPISDPGAVTRPCDRQHLSRFHRPYSSLGLRLSILPSVFSAKVQRILVSPNTDR